MLLERSSQLHGLQLLFCFLQRKEKEKKMVFFYKIVQPLHHIKGHQLYRDIHQHHHSVSRQTSIVIDNEAHLVER